MASLAIALCMLSDDQKKAVLAVEHALECLEALFSAVGAQDLLRLVYEWQGRLEAGEKIDPHELSLGNRATLGDVTFNASSGYNVTSSQQVWVTACFENATGVAGVAAMYLWIYDRLVDKEAFAIGDRREPEVHAVCCSRCGVVWVERREVERISAEAWAQFQVRPLIEAGRGKEAANEALVCGSCSIFIAAVEDVLRQKNIRSVENRGEICPSCGAHEEKYSSLVISWESVGRALERRVT